MRFRQLDQIVDLQPGSSICARRTVSGDDLYFQDHFPHFPVLPGVLTLEAMFQACDWLMRSTDDFSRSVVALQEARNVKYSGFVRPGQTFQVTAQIKKLDEQRANFMARTTVGEQTVASGRLVVERFDLADRYPGRAAIDPLLRQQKREQFLALDPAAPQQRPVPATHYRWMWIDRLTEFISGQRARAVKAVTLTDPPMDLYLPGYPDMPRSLIIEGLAQTGGILVSEYKDFAEPVVLAKVSKALFHRPALAGDTLSYEAEITDFEPEGAMVRATSHAGGELQAEVELFFAYLDETLAPRGLIEPADVLALLRMFGLYEVGQTGAGEPLTIPPSLRDAESQLLVNRA